MAERVFFERGAVKVTSARVVLGSQTYAVAQLSSVGAAYEAATRWPAYLLALMGAFVMAAQLFVGLAVIAAAISYLVTRKDRHHVLLMTSGGEYKSLASFDKSEVDEVVGAISEAIVHRG